MEGMDGWIPSPKVATGAALATPVTVLVTWLAAVIGHPMPSEVAGALGALIAGILTYLIPNPTSHALAEAARVQAAPAPGGQ